MTRRLIPISAGLLAGLFAAFHLCVNGSLGSFGFIYLILAAGFLGFSAIIFRPSFRVRMLVFCSAFAVACAYSAVYTALRLVPLETLDGETVTIVGRVENFTDGDRSAVTVNGRVDGMKTKALVYISGFNGDIGDEITLSAKISKLSDSPFFRSREYYFSDGVLVTASAEGLVEITPSKSTIICFLRSYSRRVSLSIRQTVDGEEAGELLAAMVTGDRTVFSDSLRLKLNRAGVGHIAAVSGLHVSIVALAVMMLLRKLRAPRILNAALTELCVCAFIVFSGLRASAIRAGVMMTVAILSTFAKRRADPLNTVCLCGILMMARNPYSAANSSLLLSLAGAFGVAVMSTNVDREFGLKGRLAQSLSASFCACAATAPLIMLYFNELSIASPLTNLFAIPLCSLAVLLGVIYALFGCTLPALIRTAGFLTGAVVKVCGFISQFSFIYIPTGSKALAISVWIAFAVVLTAYLVSKEVRSAAMLAVFCAAVVICIYGVQSFVTRNDIYLTVLSRSGDSALVLRKGGECIIIDFDGTMADSVETVIERSGISRIRAVILDGGAVAGYSVYADMPITPDVIYLPEGDYVYGGRVPCQNLPDGSMIGIFGLTVTVSNGGVWIEFSDGVVPVSQDGKEMINLLNGITVVNENGEISAYKGDIIKEIKIGRGIYNGGQSDF